jgi:hypothetical protein
VASNKKAGLKGPAPRRPKKPSAAAWIDASSYWIDERVPDLGDLLPAEALDQFIAWLGPRLGSYRGGQLVAANTPTPKQEANALSEFRQHVQAVVDALHTSGLPPIASAHLQTLAFKNGVDWRRVRDDFQTIGVLAQMVERSAQSVSTPKGRKPASSRDALAAAVFKKLQQIAPRRVEDARSLTREILLRCRVPAPDDLKRPISKVQK